MNIKVILKKIIRILKSFFKPFPNVSNIFAHNELYNLYPNPNSSCWTEKREHQKRIKDDILLSIVIPSFNNAHFLSECIDSVISQSTQFHYEVIIVNDGSTDNTKDLLKKYENIDNIRVIHQANLGFSGARNTGLNYACGNYIMFVDSDDTLLPGSIDALMICAIENNADIAVGGYLNVFVDGTTSIGKKYKNEQLQPLGNIHGQPWAKVYKFNLFDNLKFPENYWYEDSIFASIVWPQCQRVFTVNQLVYAYKINPNGISASSKGKLKSLDSLYIYERLLEDRKIFKLDISFDDFLYFLRMVKLTYKRTEALDDIIRYYIFVIQCNLYKEHFLSKNYSTDCKMYKLLIKALKERNYFLYTTLCEM